MIGTLLVDLGLSKGELYVGLVEVFGLEMQNDGFVAIVIMELGLNRRPNHWNNVALG